MTNQHTPAPWVYTPSARGSEAGIRNKGGYICFMTKVTRYDGQEGRYLLESAEKEANAQLIAAAPELLEALKEACVIIKKHTYPCPDKPNHPSNRVDEFEKLIAKAEGK